jgi:predicted secreted Zn-dependent protease
MRPLRALSGALLLAGCCLFACAEKVAAPPPPVPMPPEPPADPAVSETFAVQKYAVSGSSIAEVRRSMAAARPANADGRRFDSITFWHVNWHYDRSKEPDGCAAAGVRASLELTMKFPDFAAVPERTSAAFSGFLTALRQHEEGHLRIDRGIASEVVEAVRAVPAQPDCGALDSAVQRAAQKAMDLGRARNAEYDARTEHGYLQGAVYPAQGP